MQGIWSATSPISNSISKPLYSDACSSIIFNLKGSLIIDNHTLSEGVIIIPIEKNVRNIIISAGAELAGIRFHPAVGYGIFGKHYEQPTLLNLKQEQEQEQQYNLHKIHSSLKRQSENDGKIHTLQSWLEQELDFTDLIPDSLFKALSLIKQDGALNQLEENIELSQRQVERMFKSWLGITPKYYQRILRVKKVICFLRLNKQVNLANVAQQFGFSDQSHMTRELRSIASITPRQL